MLKKIKNVNDDVEIFFIFFHNETKHVKYQSHTQTNTIMYVIYTNNKYNTNNCFVFLCCFYLLLYMMCF